MVLKNLKNITKYDIFIFLLFLIGFILSVLDFSLLSFFKEILIPIIKWKFILSYFILIYFLYKTINFFMIYVPKVKILKEDKFLIKLKKGVSFFLLGYFIGILINLSNAFVIATFDKFFY